MDTILIISQYRYPDGDAGSVRMYSFARTIKDMGYNVFVFCLGSQEKEIQQYRGIPYKSLRKPSPYDSYLGFNRRLIESIDNIKRKTNVRAIVLGSCFFNVLIRLKKYCRANNIILVKDVVEWYSPSQFKYGKFSVGYFFNDFINRYLIDKSVRVISISTYLEKYYKSKKIITERIPVYFDQSEFLDEKGNYGDKLELLYAGSPLSNKDRIDLILKGLSLLDDEALKKIHFVIIGVSVPQVKTLLLDQLDTFDRIEPSLTIIGRIPRPKVLEYLLKCDFTVLMRDSDKRNTQAGFPTKVIESISTSTPVIMNFTSDLGLYFKDNINSIEVVDNSAVSFADSIKRALSLTKSEKKIISVNAKELAIDSFNKDSYTSKFEILLK